MRASTLSLALATLVAAGSSCAQGEYNEECKESTCGLPTAPSTVDNRSSPVSCWLEEIGDKARGGHSLYCSYSPEHAGPVEMMPPVLTIAELGIDQELRPNYVEALANIGYEDAIPNISVLYRYAKQDVVLGIHTLKHTSHSIASNQLLASANGDKAHVPLPFDLWPLEIVNRYPRSATLRFSYGLPFEPVGHWVEADMALRSFGYGQSRLLAVPVGLDELEVAVRTDELVLPALLSGPGQYTVDGDGELVASTTNQDAKKSTQSASCVLREEGAAASLRCEAILGEAVSSIAIDIEGADGSFRSFSILPGEAKEANFELASLPIEVEARIQAKQRIVGLESVANRSFRENAVLDLGSQQQLEVGLPFAVSKISLTGGQGVRAASLDIAPYAIDFAQPWSDRYALQSYAQRLEGLLTGETVSFLIAHSANKKLIADVEVQDLFGRLHRSEVPLVSGDWVLAEEGLIPKVH